MIKSDELVYAMVEAQKFQIYVKNSTYRDCRGRRRNKGHHDARRSPHVARQEANSILYEDTICLKQIIFC